MSVFYKDPSELFKKFHIFWPSRDQSADEKINASARFIIYSSVVVYLFTRDIRIFLLALVAITTISILGVNNLIQEKFRSGCVRGTLDNPMGNFLMSDYTDRPDRPSACGTIKELNAQEKLLAASFPTDSGDFWEEVRFESLLHDAEYDGRQRQAKIPGIILWTADVPRLPRR